MASVLQWRRPTGALRASGGDADAAPDIEGRSSVELRIETSSSSHRRLLQAMSDGMAQFVVTSADGAVSAKVRLKMEGLARTVHQIRSRSFSVDWSTAVVECERERALLSRTELRLLAVLLHSHGDSMSRTELVERLWPHGEFVPSNRDVGAVDAYVTSLRRALNAIGLSGALEMRQGRYRMAVV